MKQKELKAMNEQDLNSKVAELKKELMKTYSQIAIGTIPKSPGRVKEMKKTIAKIFTINNQKIRMKEEQKRND
ncbi:50S ribosomal protein L29 [Candidatus Woesearchaeota archaeon]|nr:50S ribosomal protein L29 [Candidatus Woesearchaeota archaeon]